MLLIIMKKQLTLILLILSSFIFIAFSYKNDTITTEKFEIEKLHFYKPTKNLKLIVFMPSLYIDCEYASMLTTSLNYYFVQGLAFNKTIPKPKIDVVLVVNDHNKWEEYYTKRKKDSIELVKKNSSVWGLGGQIKNRNIMNNILVNYDKEGVFFKSLGIDTFQSTKNLNKGYYVRPELLRNESSTLFLLDENNNILFKDIDYRAQGEHLKPLEKYIKEHLNINKVENKNVKYKKLKVGDKAPDIFLKEKLNNFKKDSISIKNKLSILEDTTSLKEITFYPATFSGKFPVYSKKQQKDRDNRMSCFRQIGSFDCNPDDSYELRKNIKTYVVSSSTDQLLSLWETALETRCINYLNDEDYTISKTYNAYNSKGYNNRVTYLIDKKGIIKYIDYDYTIEDKKALKEAKKKTWGF